ncbi:MAG: transglutaminase domain-containing protein [Bacteroidota bacterium]
MPLNIFALLTALFLSTSSLLALDSLDLRQLDFIRKTVPTEVMSLRSLSDTLLAEADSDFNAAELAFYWIAEHIEYDFEAEQLGGESADLEQVLRTRRGNMQTFSQIYRELCSRMGLQCYLIRGYANLKIGKELPEHFYDGTVGDIPDRPNHSWNLVKIDSVYYGVDVSLGAGFLGGTEEEAVFVKKYDYAQILVSEGIFFKIHLAADPRWQFREHPLSLTTFFKDVPYAKMVRTHQYGQSFDYQAAIAAFEVASAAEQRLLTLQSTHEFNPSNFNLRQYADALYNMGYTQSAGDYESKRLVSARKYYQEAIEVYKKVRSTPEVQQLVAQAHQGITYIQYRLDTKQ